MRVRVLGAGIVGLSVADELVRRGHDVTVHDPDPGGGASYAAAGMLSPAAEVWHGEDELLDLGRRSLALWPAYAERLGVPLRGGGTLLVGHDHGDLQQVERQVDLLRRHGAPVDLLDRRQVRRLEPAVARVACGALLADEASIAPREVVAALRERVPVEPTASAPEADPRWDVTVVATGTRLPPPFADVVRGVRGEVLRARTDDPPTRTVRGWVRGEPVYVVPRAAGEVVVGATSEEHDAPPVVTLGGVLRVLRAAAELVPGLDHAELLEAVARDRPGTRDNLPLVGPTGTPGLLLAAGHFRHGVLLAPLTARLVADQVADGVEGGARGEPVEPALDPRRFTEERSTPCASG